MKSVLEAMRAGAHDYLTKPFQQEDLTIAVKRCLDRQSLSNEVNELRKINALYRISKAMSSEMELEKLLRLIMQSAIATLHADSGSLMLVDKNKKTMTIKTSAGMEGKKIESQKIRIGEGISGWVAAKGKPLLLIEDMKDYPQFSSLKIRKEIKSAICVPMKIKDAVTGVLSINNVKSENIYTDDDMKILTILAGDAALAIHNASLLETTREQFTQLKQKIAVKGENRCPKKRKR